MHLRDVCKKREAEHFAYVIQNSTVHFYDYESRSVFENIINEVHNCDLTRRYYSEGVPKISDEAPFVQGDKKGNGLPDIIYENEKFVLGIEDFEFDSSTKIRKGSKMRMAELSAERELKQKRVFTGENTIVTETMVDVCFSYEGYISSLLDAFDSHTKNINNYRNAIKSNFPNKKIILAFYIEDITAIGNYIVTKEGTKPMCPFFVKEFLDVLKKTDGIDYVISRVQNAYTYALHFSKIDCKSLNSLYKNAYDMEEDKFFSYFYKKVQHTKTNK